MRRDSNDTLWALLGILGGAFAVIKVAFYPSVVVFISQGCRRNFTALDLIHQVEDGFDFLLCHDLGDGNRAMVLGLEQLESELEGMLVAGGFYHEDVLVELGTVTDVTVARMPARLA